MRKMIIRVIDTSKLVEWNDSPFRTH